MHDFFDILFGLCTLTLMARQVGPIFLEGTVDDLTFYHSDGKWLVKRKSSLNRKKFLRRPCFAHTRRNAAWFGSANKLASAVYSCVLEPYRSRDFYNFLAARAQQLIREGLEGPAVMARLVRYLRIVGVALMPEEATKGGPGNETRPRGLPKVGKPLPFPASGPTAVSRHHHPLPRVLSPPVQRLKQPICTSKDYSDSIGFTTPPFNRFIWTSPKHTLKWNCVCGGSTEPAPPLPCSRKTLAPVPCTCDSNGSSKFL